MILNLLQRNFNNAPPGANQPPDPAMVITLLIVYGTFILIFLVIAICFYLSLSKCIREIKPRNRTIQPGQVWLNFIPFFNIVWFILMVLKISESLKNEYEDRGWRGEGDYGKTFGICMYVSMWLSSCLTPLPYFIFLVLYWVKIAGYTKKLKADNQPSRGRRSRDRNDELDDEDDDRPRRRPRDDDEDDDRPRR